MSLNAHIGHETPVDEPNDELSSGSPSGSGDGITRWFRLPYHLVGPMVMAVDLMVVIAVSVLAAIAYNWFFLGVMPVAEIQTYGAIGLLTFINVSAILTANGDYQVTKLSNFYRQTRDLAFIWSCVFLVLIGIAFSLKVAETFSRGATFTFFVLGLGSMIVWRGLLAQLLKHVLSVGAFTPRKVILIGEPQRIAASRSKLELQRCGYIAIQTFEIVEETVGTNNISRSLRVTIDSAIKVARAQSVTEVFLLIGWEHRRTIESISNMLRLLPISVYLLPDENVDHYLGFNRLNVGTTWATAIQRAPLTRTEQFIKRCFDLVGATSILLLLSPIMLLTALLIKLDSSGPILFFQSRNGFNGRVFRIVKFRTMHVLEDSNVIRQATRGDPRVTRLGRWLRQTSIDELPQLFNVLSGNMSLIGPRPHAITHNNEYEKLIANYAFRHNVRPGISGWAQVNGFRGETATADLMAKRIECDLWYITHWSIGLDFLILFRTLTTILRPVAY